MRVGVQTLTALLFACACLAPSVHLAAAATATATDRAPSQQQEQQACAWERQGGIPLDTASMSAALVLGGTGAVGHHIVQQLLASDRWSKVVTLGRREVPLPADQPGTGKLQQVTLNLDDLGSSAEGKAAFDGVDAVFCALGTTRGAAGSAAAFKKVDLEYVAAAAAAAKAAGVRYFGLVSAQGANAAVPASDFALLHPLLYTQTKGKAEQAVKAQGFARAAIFRPGMLKREDMARTWERLASPLLGGILVSDVARAMIADAEAFKAGAAGGATATFEMSALKRAAAAGGAPTA